MTDQPRLIPGSDHPITVAPNPNRVVVRFGDAVIADTRAALTLQESTYPAVQYIPRADVDFAVLQRTDHHTYCPYKGDCAYYSIQIDGRRGENAVWTYEHPHDAVAAIKDHVAFYPNQVTMSIAD
jgi:uncharacterized protein (DUF427 family)